MSFDAMAWAIKQKPKSSSEKFVLLMIADSANSETGLCFPSMESIAARTMLTRQTVLKCVASLEQQRLIEVIRKRTEGGFKTSHHYVLPIHSPMSNYSLTDVKPVNVHDVKPFDSKQEGEPLTSNKDKNLLLDSGESSEKTVINSRTERFEGFWKHYPKKAGKKAALKAWLKIDEAAYPAIKIGLKNYLASKKVAEGFILDCVNWLKGERWTDEVELADENTDNPYLIEIRKQYPEAYITGNKIRSSHIATAWQWSAETGERISSSI